MNASFSPVSPVAINVADTGSGDGGRAARSAETDQRVACHEASHAVVARLIGLELGGVTCEPSGEFSGMCWGPGRAACLSESTDDVPALFDKLRQAMPKAGEKRDVVTGEILQFAVNRLVEIAAGSAGETMLVGNCWPSPHDRKLEAMFALLVSTSSGSAEWLVRYATASARDLLAANLPIVVALADALLVERTMNGERIDEVIGEAVVQRQLVVEHERRRDWRKREENARGFRHEQRVGPQSAS